jgi:Protein of unknown function (DUF3800)
VVGSLPFRNGGEAMRLILLDEAGRASRAQEPFLVVAGVIIDPDKMWKSLDTYFRDMTKDLFPDREPDKFVFHAHQLWHGTGDFPKSKWPLRERMKIFKRLAQVPSLFGFPIVVGIIDRNTAREELLRNNPDLPPKTIDNLCHVTAFLVAIQKAEHWLSKNVPNETAMIIAEDAGKIKGALCDVHEGYTDPTLNPLGAFRSERIIDALYFAAKKQSLLLQLADHCAFITKRQAMGDPHMDDHFESVRPQLSDDFQPAESFAMRVRLEDLALPDDTPLADVVRKTTR